MLVLQIQQKTKQTKIPALTELLELTFQWNQDKKTNPWRKWQSYEPKRTVLLRSNKRDSLLCKSERNSEVPTGSPKKTGPCWAPWPAWESKGSLSTLYHSLRVEVNAQSSPGGPLGHLKVYPQTNGISNQRKPMVVQICFNQDSSLSNMKFSEDEHNLQIIKKQNHETKIVYSIIV